MRGIILSGGKSTRMQTDKGLIKIHNKTWVEIAFETLSKLEFPVIVSVNNEQYDSYQIIFNPEFLVEDNQNINVFGPLKGILSAHLAYPNEDLFILACDMIAMKNKILKNLLDDYFQKLPNALVYSQNGHTEPLCGIYSAKALAELYQLSQNNQLKSFSMKNALEQIKSEYIEIPHNWLEYFKNYNSTNDLKNP